MLRADNVSFAYPSSKRLVLHEVSATVPRGDTVGILGPNGSGKTTLLRLLTGAIRPSMGGVTLDGRPLSSFSRRHLARRIASVPQETHLTFDYRVLDVVLMGRHPHLGAFQLEGPEDLAIARDALAATGTADLEDRAFASLSGGEKQRVVIASALAQSTELLTLDEPTASLDLRYQLDVAALLSRLNRVRGVTMVLSTHDLNFAAGICRRVVLLRGGRVLAEGPTEEVLNRNSIRQVYDVDAEVRYHAGAGHLTIVPIATS